MSRLIDCVSESLMNNWWIIHQSSVAILRFKNSRTARLTLPPLKTKKFSRKYNNYSQIIWKMTYIPTLFSHLRHKVYLRRYGRPTWEVMFTRSSICRTQAVQILFCIDKARKSSFTEVALNSVLEENAASAIDFEWEFYSPNKNIIYE